MRRIGIITQARTTSTRLPNKIFMDIAQKPLLTYHIQRLQESGLPIYIATTSNHSDDTIEDFAKQKHLPFFRGSENNVLSRFYLTAKQYELDIVVRVTSDCPLIDGKLIKEGIEQYFFYQKNNIYLSNCLERTFPRGFDFEIFSFELLENAYLNATSEADMEHVSPFINQNKSGNVVLKHFKRKTDKSQYRITVDTTEDFELVQKLIENYNAHFLSADHIIGLLDENPDLVAINQHIEQKKL